MSKWFFSRSTYCVVPYSLAMRLGPRTEAHICVRNRGSLTSLCQQAYKTSTCLVSLNGLSKDQESQFLHSSIMSESMPVQEKLESEGVSTTISQIEKDHLSFSIDEDVAKIRKRIWRKLDIRLLPLTSLLYLLCFL